MTDSKESYKEILGVKGLTCSLQWYLMMFSFVPIGYCDCICFQVSTVILNQAKLSLTIICLFK